MHKGTGFPCLYALRQLFAGRIALSAALPTTLRTRRTVRPTGVLRPAGRAVLRATARAAVQPPNELPYDPVRAAVRTAQRAAVQPPQEPPYGPPYASRRKSCRTEDHPTSRPYGGAGCWVFVVLAFQRFGLKAILHSRLACGLLLLFFWASFCRIASAKSILRGSLFSVMVIISSKLGKGLSLFYTFLKACTTGIMEAGALLPRPTLFLWTHTGVFVTMIKRFNS